MSNKVSRAFSKVINLVVAATAQGASKGELGLSLIHISEPTRH